MSKRKTDNTMPKTTASKSLQVPSSIYSVMTAEIEGTSLLVVHRFSEKAKRQIREKQQKIAKLAKGARDPEAEFKESLYRFDDGSYGFPTGSLAMAVVAASVDVLPKHKSLIRRNLYVEDDGYSEAPESRGLIRILDANGDPAQPTMREDVVRLGGMTRTADLRYRGAFAPGWRATVRIKYNSNMLSDDQVAQLLLLAGTSIGICEARPEKTLALRWGTFGVSKLALYSGKAA